MGQVVGAGQAVDRRGGQADVDRDGRVLQDGPDQAFELADRRAVDPGPTVGPECWRSNQVDRQSDEEGSV